MPGSEGPEKYLRWRVRADDPVGRRRRRWPIGMLGSGLTEVPDEEPVAAGEAGRGSRRSGRTRGPVGPWRQMFIGRTVVAAGSVSWLRHLLEHPVTQARVRRITIVVDDWQIPQRGWSGRLGPLPHLLDERIGLPRADRGRVVVEIEVRWSVPLRSVLVAVLPLLVPVRPMPTPGSPEVTAQDVLPSWLGAGPNVGAVAGELAGSDDIRPYDIVLHSDDGPPDAEADPAVDPAVDRAVDPAVDRAVDRAGRPADAGDEGGPAGTLGDGAGLPYRAVFAVDRFGAGVRAGDGVGAGREVVLVDLEHAVPAGRYGPFGPAASRAELTFPAGPDGRSWRIVGPDGIDCGGRLDRPWLTEEIRATLAGVGVLDCRSVPGRHPAAEAALLLHLVLTGVLVHAPGLPPVCRGHLADELVDLLAGPLPDRPGTSPDRYADLEWEVRTVRQRRAAMRRHSRDFVLSRLAANTFPGFAGLPSVSALLVTRRLAYVLDAVAAIEAQSYPELEIVLCLHGVALPADLRVRLGRCGRPLEIVQVPAGHSFGEAIAAATARAGGSLVTKFDDDDTYGPEHVWDLVLARHQSGATLVGKPAEFVYLQTLDTTVRRDAGAPESFAPVVAGGTMLIGRGDLEQVGGWRPVPRSVDRGLIDRVRRAGGLVYRTHPLGYVYQRRSAGHTWDPGLEYFLRDSGAQWPGLPRHGEFGTVPQAAATIPESPVCGPGTTASSGINPGTTASSGINPGTPVSSGTGPGALRRTGLPAPAGAADDVTRRRDGSVTGHCRLP